MIAPDQIPPGYRVDARGRLWPESQIKPIDQQRDLLVNELAMKAKRYSAELGQLKGQLFGDIEAFVQLSAEQYGVRLGGDKGNVSLLSFDGKFKVERAIAEVVVFDERLQAAKELIDECLREWTIGSRDEARLLIEDAFRVDAAGNIRAGSVLGLRRLNIEDERWQRAMQAIGDAVQIVGTRPYVRIYERNERGEYEQVPLNLATV